MEQPQTLDVGFAVPVGGRSVHLQRVVQWPLPTAPGGRLQLSVPVEHAESFARVLVETRAERSVPAESLKALLACWEMVPGELSIDGHVEPSLLLAHTGATEAHEGILVASWPTREALDSFRDQQVLPAAQVWPQRGSCRSEDVVMFPTPVFTTRRPCVSDHRRTRSAAL